MKAFFKELNFARGIILASVVLALALGWLGWQRSRDLAVMKQQLEVNMRPLAKDLMQTAQRHTQLSRAYKDENLAGQTDLASYIRKVAQADKIDIGGVNFTNTNQEVTKGVVDKIYTIRPEDRTAKFQRLKIANFLYTLEYDSRRVKVTHIAIRLANERVKDYEVPEDLWTFDAAVTSRQRAE